MADAFHQTAIAQKAVSLVVNDGVTFTVELRCQGFFCNGKPYRIGNALPQGTCGGFHPCGIAIFRMSWGF